MNNLKQTEKLMRHSERLANVSYENAFKKVIEIFLHIDERDNSNHCEIINILYDVKNKTLTYVGIANKMHISDNALRRYRKDYVDWFNYFLSIEYKNSVS